MAVFFVLSLVFALVAADWEPKAPAVVNKMRTECFQSEKVSEENIALINNRKYPDEESVRCYVRCTVLKMDIWDDTNGYNTDRVRTQLGKLGYNFSKENLSNCITKTPDGRDSCTWAYKDMACLVVNHQPQPTSSPRPIGGS